MWTHFSKKRSCMDFDTAFSASFSVSVPPSVELLLSMSLAFWRKSHRRDCSLPCGLDVSSVFSLSWEYDEEATSLELLKRTTGMGESRLAKVLPLDSSIVAAVVEWLGGYEVAVMVEQDSISTACGRRALPWWFLLGRYAFGCVVDWFTTARAAGRD